MARKGKAGDIATNARKRYYRQAERYLKQANRSTGAVAGRYRELARQRLDDAIETYSANTTQKFSKPIQRIADELGIDLGAKREKMQKRSDKTADKRRESAISESENLLRENAPTGEDLRQAEARAILNSSIGQRIIGGTVDIWREAATYKDSDGKYRVDKYKILPALFEHYEVDNLADLLEAIEGETGAQLYRDPDSNEAYETVKLLLQIGIIIGSNSVVQ